METEKAVFCLLLFFMHKNCFYGSLLSKYNRSEQKIMENSWWWLLVQWGRFGMNGLLHLPPRRPFRTAMDVHTGLASSISRFCKMIVEETWHVQGLISLLERTFSWSIGETTSRQFWCNNYIQLEEVIPVGCSESCIHNVSQ